MKQIFSTVLLALILCFAVNAQAAGGGPQTGEYTLHAYTLSNGTPVTSQEGSSSDTIAFHNLYIFSNAMDTAFSRDNDFLSAKPVEHIAGFLHKAVNGADIARGTENDVAVGQVTSLKIGMTKTKGKLPNGPAFSVHLKEMVIMIAVTLFSRKRGSSSHQKRHPDRGSSRPGWRVVYPSWWCSHH